MKSRKMIRKLIKMSIAVSSLTLLLTVSLLADSRTGTLTGKIQLTRGRKDENSIVYLKGIKGQFALPQAVAVLDQKGKRFIPHLLPVQKGQRVVFGNSDSFSHNVHLYWGRRSMFNQVQGIKGTSEWSPPRTGEYLILCDLHREMSAFALVFDHPFFAIVDHPSPGEFKIGNVPPGTYTLVVVQDVKGKLKKREQEVTVIAGQTNTVEISF
ncbi:carboxypeptidase regulatory-like domain-containing protein [Acidobacteria bacterium AH-259-G07]|nr:carboxypeptidase regulatory-like domain-containing protein [Acidobacteria bacterium AH-259-G07]